MSTRKTSYILAFVLGFTFMLPSLRADESDQATKVTFSQAVQLPGRTLPAGTYWFERAGTTNSELVRVYNSDHEFVGNFFTITRERHDVTSHTAFIFADQGAGKAQALVAWFYPGETLGHEFQYAKPLRQELARDKKETVVAGD